MACFDGGLGRALLEASKTKRRFSPGGQEDKKEEGYSFLPLFRKAWRFLQVDNINRPSFQKGAEIVEGHLMQADAGFL